MDESKRTRAAIGNVDACRALRTGTSVTDASVARGDMIVLRGWIAAPDGSCASDRAVWIDIDGSDARAALRSDVKREDVASASDSDELRFCGYVAVIPTETLGIGSHTLTAFVSCAQDSAFALPAIAFEIAGDRRANPVSLDASARFVGKIDEWTVTGNHILVRGWAFDRVARQPVSDVYVPMQAERASAAVIGFARHDVAWTFADDLMIGSGFRFHSAIDDSTIFPSGLVLTSPATAETGWLSRDVEIGHTEAGEAARGAASIEAMVLADILELDRARIDSETGERFDAEFGVDTQAPMFFAPADTHESDPEHSRHYEAVPIGALEEALERIPFDPAGATFVDFGCGKGRAMVMAAKRPFAAIVGVELSPTLAAIARANLERLDRSQLRCDSIAIVEGDAAEYEPPPGDIVAFLYNPFDETVLAPILERLANAACERVAIVYANPVHGNIIEANSVFERVASFDSGVVFERRRVPMQLVLPEEFDREAYRDANEDLFELSDDELESHYDAFGEAEGRRANGLLSREAFAALIPADADVLEIGPYHTPLLHGPRTKYFDVLTRDAMLERAAREGVDGSGAPAIDFVSPTGDLDIVDVRFDFVLSSHALEHQPDLISHLQKVERLLRPGGRYFVILPDKRYCFDHFSAQSGLAEIVEAYVERRTGHTLRSILGQSVMSTHNDCVRHWNGDHGSFLEAPGPRIEAGIEAYESARGEYVDVHAWYFTPASARAVFGALGAAGYTSFEIERLYPTRRDAFEFWLVLRKRERDPL